LKAVLAEKPSVVRELASFLGAGSRHEGYFEGGLCPLCKSDVVEQEMTECDRMRDQIERASDGDPWCEPSPMSVLEGASSGLAARRVHGLSHSIREIVLHVSDWQMAVARRITGDPVATPEGGEWTEVHDTSDPGSRALHDRFESPKA
jgi:hypothetical protein